MLQAQLHQYESQDQQAWQAQSYIQDPAPVEPIIPNLAARLDVPDILKQFNSYQLEDLNKANLMDRVDVKFILPIAMLAPLLMRLKPYYQVLDINKQRISNYYNQYFDTANMDLYQAHHNGKLNRYKVRERTYLDTQTRFIEVKFKNNRKRTIKTRINCSEKLDSPAYRNAFVQLQMGESYQAMVVSQQSGYQRIALANEASAERLTLDHNLWYRTHAKASKISLPGFFIAELKQAKRSKLSPFFQLMSKNMIFPASFSKYCVGCALLYPNALKTNQFNATLRQIANLSSSQHLAIHKSN